MITSIEQVAELPMLPTELEVLVRLSGRAGFRAYARDNPTEAGSQAAYRCPFEPRNGGCEFCWNTGVTRMTPVGLLDGTGLDNLDTELRAQRAKTDKEIRIARQFDIAQRCRQPGGIGLPPHTWATIDVINQRAETAKL